MFRSTDDRRIATPVPSRCANAARRASSRATGTGPAGEPAWAASSDGTRAQERTARARFTKISGERGLRPRKPADRDVERPPGATGPSRSASYTCLDSALSPCDRSLRADVLLQDTPSGRRSYPEPHGAGVPRARSRERRVPRLSAAHLVLSRSTMSLAVSASELAAARRQARR